jgi:hypothetical protein
MMSAGIFSIVDEKPPHPHAISVFIFCFSLLSSPSSLFFFLLLYFLCKLNVIFHIKLENNILSGGSKKKKR